MAKPTDTPAPPVLNDTNGEINIPTGLVIENLKTKIGQQAFEIAFLEATRAALSEEIHQLRAQLGLHLGHEHNGTGHDHAH